MPAKKYFGHYGDMKTQLVSEFLFIAPLGNQLGADLHIRGKKLLRHVLKQR